MNWQSDHAAGAGLSTSELTSRYIMPNYGRFPIAFTEAKGIRIRDEKGRSYIDFGTGIAVCPLGHSHSAITSAVHTQVEALIHSSNLYEIREQALLARFITEELVGIPGKVFFCNSGAEANEALYKLTRAFGHAVPRAGGPARYELITFENSFHGRTLAGLGATGQSKVREGFAPIPMGFKNVPYNDLKAVKKAITPDTAGILLEPVQGESGIQPANPDFLRGLAKLCRKHQLLFMYDEVQCGIGRLGDLCGWRAILDEPEVEPDAISWAKGLGGGLPIGSVWIKQRPVSAENPDQMLCDIMGPGSHGTTFGGNPLVSTVALAVLEEIKRHDLCGNATRIGDYMMETIRGWDSPLVSTVRGLGLMIGIVLDLEQMKSLDGCDADNARPSVYAVNQLMEKGLLTVPARENVVRLLPPLNITRGEADEALAILKSFLKP